MADMLLTITIESEEEYEYCQKLVHDYLAEVSNPPDSPEEITEKQIEERILEASAYFNTTEHMLE